MISLGLMLIIWMGMGMRGVNRLMRPEYFLFLSLSCLGLFLMTSAVELLTIVVSIEIASYALFVLIPLRRQPFPREPLEASIKYYFLGALATGITLYGMSYLFGLTHSTYLADIAQRLPGMLDSQPLAVIGLAMLLCAAFYKLALFPLHFWMPDVFVGAAHETTCFVATVPKVAAIALIVRFVSLAGPDAHQVVYLLSIMAALSMFAGNLSASRVISSKLCAGLTPYLLQRFSVRTDHKSGRRSISSRTTMPAFMDFFKLRFLLPLTGNLFLISIVLLRSDLTRRAPNLNNAYRSS